jgi:SAM-dependent methyltransferase
MSLHEPTLQFHFARMFDELSAGYGGVMISIGHKLGLYRAMAGAGGLTSDEVAKRSGCAPRYVQEWLNSQVAGRCIDYDAATRTYRLTDEQAAILADETSAFFLPNAWQVVASQWADEDKAIHAFRTGEGIAWGDHDPRLHCGTAAFFRNGYSAHLVQDWLPALDGVVAKLEAGADVADIGCGYGDSTILMAKAFPHSRYWGFDTHEASIEVARAAAKKNGLDCQVSFEVRNAREPIDRRFDLICFFDALHDMGRPLDAAKAALAMLKPGGTVLLVEPFANDRVEDNIGSVGRIYYSASTTLCCAHAISEKGTHVLGAQTGKTKLVDLLKEAGFGAVRVAAETPFNLIIEARA